MYNMRNVGSVLGLTIVTYFNINLHTDYFHGARDPFGPYPRIPDAEKLKVTFAFTRDLYCQSADFFNVDLSNSIGCCR